MPFVKVQTDADKLAWTYTASGTPNAGEIAFNQPTASLTTQIQAHATTAAGATFSSLGSLQIPAILIVRSSASPFHVFEVSAVGVAANVITFTVAFDQANGDETWANTQLFELNFLPSSGGGSVANTFFGDVEVGGDINALNDVSVGNNIVMDGGTVDGEVVSRIVTQGAGAPTAPNNSGYRLYVDTVSDTLYHDDGTAWVALSGGGGGITDHTLLQNIGTNTHAQIDTHIADATVHFTEASIDKYTQTQVDGLLANKVDTSAVGTAAALDAGVTIGDVVQVVDVGGAVAGLPAIDGSQLTGITGTGSGVLPGYSYDYADGLDPSGVGAMPAGTLRFDTADPTVSTEVYVAQADGDGGIPIVHNWGGLPAVTRWLRITKASAPDQYIFVETDRHRTFTDASANDYSVFDVRPIVADPYDAGITQSTNWTTPTNGDSFRVEFYAYPDTTAYYDIDLIDANIAHGLSWEFDNADTADTDPGAGLFKVSVADLTTLPATLTLYISKTTVGGATVPLPDIVPDNSWVQLSRTTERNEALLGQVNGAIVDGTTYWKLTLDNCTFGSDQVWQERGFVFQFVAAPGASTNVNAQEVTVWTPISIAEVTSIAGGTPTSDEVSFDSDTPGSVTEIQIHEDLKFDAIITGNANEVPSIAVGDEIYVGNGIWDVTATVSGVAGPTASVYTYTVTGATGGGTIIAATSARLSVGKKVGGVDINSLTSATVASGDLILIEDVDDSNNRKKVTAGDIAGLATGGGSGTKSLTGFENVAVDVTEVVIGGGYIDGSTGGTYSWEGVWKYNDGGGTGNQDAELRLYDDGGTLRSTLLLDSSVVGLDTQVRTTQALTASGTPGTDTDEILNTGDLYEVRLYIDAAGSVDSVTVYGVQFIEA